MQRWFAVAAGLVLGVGLGFIQFKTTQHGANGDELGVLFFQRQAAVIASELREHGKLHGRYPYNDEGLSPVAGAVQRRMGADRGHRVRIAPSGILSWWGDPLIYENRRGQSRHRFSWPVADSGPNAAYSYRVDDGVYVWSIGARTASHRISARNQRHTIVAAATLIAATALLVLYVSAAVRGRGISTMRRQMLYAAWFALSGTVTAVVVALPLTMLMNGCGCPGRQVIRTHDLTRVYVTTMRRMRDHGIISNSTLARILHNLKKDEKARAYRQS